MSDFSLTLVLQIKTSKIINDVAKVQQKSEEITAFGGIFFVLDKFARHAMHVMEEITMRLHEGEVVLMAEKVGPASLAVTQGKHSHRKRNGFPAYAEFDLAPVKLALFSRLIILLDKNILSLNYSWYRFAVLRKTP